MPIPMDNFSAADLYYDSYQGDESYYWGENPATHFGGGKFTTEPGFTATMDA